MLFRSLHTSVTEVWSVCLEPLSYGGVECVSGPLSYGGVECVSWPLSYGGVECESGPLSYGGVESMCGVVFWPDGQVTAMRRLSRQSLQGSHDH